MRTPITVAAALVLLVAPGCDMAAIAPIEAEVGEPMHLAVPKPEVRGIGTPATADQTATVATAAAVFQQPESWMVELTGEIVGGEVMDPQEVPLSSVGEITTIDSNTVQFTFGYPSPEGVGSGTVRVCAQMVHATTGGEKYLGNPGCLVRSF